MSPYNVALRHSKPGGLATTRGLRERDTHATTQRGWPSTCSALRYRADDERGTKSPSRNCHLSLAPGTWPYLGGTNAALDHSLGVQVWKSKMVRRSTVYVRSLAVYLQQGRQLAAAGTESAIYTSSPASRVRVPATRMQSHPQKMQLRLHHNPACLAVFTHGHRRRDLQGFAHVLCSIFPSSI